jgi:hypothetical protein
MSLWSKIRGTIETAFQLGLGGPYLSNDGSGNVNVQNAAQSAYVIVRGATPVAANDLATKAYVDSGAVVNDGGVQEIRFAIGTSGTYNSTTQIPLNAIVIDCEVDITTAYSNGTTIEVGNASSPALLMATSGNNPQAVGLYWLHQDTAYTGGPATVLVTIGGSPSAGAGFAIVRYVQAPQT